MKRVILDTSFILTAVKQKIDFFEEIPYLGLEIIIPVEVVSEIKKIAEKGKKLHFREDASLALEILKKNKFRNLELNDNNVDRGLIKFAEKNKDVLIATLDKDLKYQIKGQKLIIRGKKKLELI